MARWPVRLTNSMVVQQKVNRKEFHNPLRVRLSIEPCRGIAKDCAASLIGLVFWFYRIITRMPPPSNLKVLLLPRWIHAVYLHRQPTTSSLVYSWHRSRWNNDRSQMIKATLHCNTWYLDVRSTFTRNPRQTWCVCMMSTPQYKFN